jgi:hypothetical protein
MARGDDVSRFLAFCIAVSVFGWPAWGQKVETEKATQGKIVHVQTALGHLTVLEMSEPVSAVAVGSSSFRVEWRGSKVFIEPTEPGVATNLFVWTPSGRSNYELDPAGGVPQMVFAIDQPAPGPPKIKIAQIEIKRPTDPLPDKVLMDTTPVQLLGRVSGKNRISVRITDFLKQNGKILIRYSVRNDANHVYLPGTPQAVALKNPRYPQSLYTLRDYQIAPKESARLRSDGVTLVEVTKADAHLEVKPGEAATGIVTMKLPSDRARTELPHEA